MVRLGFTIRNATGVALTPATATATATSTTWECQTDLVNRAFDPLEANKLWVMDVTEHPTRTGKVHLAVVIDAWSRWVGDWSLADHIRAELVADAIQMATWKRRPPGDQVVAHSDHGSVYTSWLFGQRLRAAGLLGSMGSIGDCFDNSVAEALFGASARALDQRDCATREDLGAAMFEWIECWYNPHCGHSYNRWLSPSDFEAAEAA